MIQKLESIYLQMLRVLFLIVATGAIVIATILGALYLLNRNAEPAAVKGEVALKLDNYRAEVSTPAPGGTGEAQAVSASKNPLLEEFAAHLMKLGKRTTPDFSLNREAVDNVYAGFERDTDLGVAFIIKLNRMLADVETKPAILARLKDDFGTEIASLFDYAQREYRNQASALRNLEQQATEEAAEKRAQAQAGLYVAGVMFVGFVGLILLVVLLKIERNLRGAAIVKPGGAAEGDSAIELSRAA